VADNEHGSAELTRARPKGHVGTDECFLTQCLILPTSVVEIILLNIFIYSSINLAQPWNF
jgi:hypothetical protein